MTHRYSIVAIEHCPGAVGVIAGLTVGDAVTLVREPDNKFDKNAIMVWAGDQQIGYLPKNKTLEFAPVIDEQGVPWTKPVPVVDGLQAMPDSDSVVIHKSLTAKFVRSPNSSYPQVEVDR